MDDCFIVVQATLFESKILNQIVRHYCDASGQSINLSLLYILNRMLIPGFKGKFPEYLLSVLVSCL